MPVAPEILPILIGLWFGYVVYIFCENDDNFVRKRLVKTGNKKKIRSLYLVFAEALKPFTLKNISNQVSKNKIQSMLQSLGVASGDDDVLEFENRRLFSLLIAVIVCAVVLFLFFNTVSASCALLACYMTYKYPEYRILGIIKKKQKEFIKFFPDAVDLLSVCVEAGLGIDGAIERVAQEFSGLSKAVSTEFNRLSKDVMSGLPREEALKNMAKRVNSQDLQSFCAMLVQSEKMGTSVAQSLRVYCDTLRTRKKQRVEELVQSASAKMTIPMILFLLPALFIVILYPAVIKIMENMAG